MQTTKQKLVTAVATGLYSGYVGPWTGTSGTVPPFLIAYFFIRDNDLLLLLVALPTIGISVWSAGLAEKYMGHDSKKIVIDEWAGYFMAILFIPYSLGNYIAAFVIFRILDVLKLPPARASEKLNGGLGITMDDVVAGLQSNIVLHVWLLCYPLVAGK
ncbi:MAG: phosphatidylglycerophosphatase A [candidate division Zixibacteria bacterium]|nr:phosphatidylglycerophosphatase A [candidate division Zixibacteria bacterium]